MDVKSPIGNAFVLGKYDSINFRKLQPKIPSRRDFCLYLVDCTKGGPHQAPTFVKNR